MTTLAPPVGFQLEDRSLIGAGQFMRLSRERYHELIDSGFFAADENYELIHGYLVKKMSKNAAHIFIVKVLLIWLNRLVGMENGWHFSVQDPIGVGDSEPEPDIAILRGSPIDFVEHLPDATATSLVIEVSDSTLSYDRNVKKGLYAEAGVQQYWIVNVRGRQIEIYTEPFLDNEEVGYAKVTVLSESDSIAVLLDGVDFGTIPLANLFPPIGKQP